MKKLLVIAISAAILTSPTAYAKVNTPTNYGFVTPVDSNGAALGGTDKLSLTGANGPNNTQTFFVSYSDSYASSISQIYFTNPANQNAGTIATAMNDTFGLSGASALDALNAKSSSANLSGSSVTIGAPTSFNYLSIHLGGGDLFFHFNTAVNNLAFTSSGPASGFSNYRAFNNIAVTPNNIAVTPVPEPEEWALMVIGLGLIGFKLRNRKNENQDNKSFVTIAC